MLRKICLILLFLAFVSAGVFAQAPNDTEMMLEVRQIIYSANPAEELGRLNDKTVATLQRWSGRVAQGQVSTALSLNEFERNMTTMLFLMEMGIRGRHPMSF
jgi:hypothetical protein